MKSLFTLMVAGVAAVSLSTSALACPEVAPAQSPEIVDGSTASVEAMYSTQKQVADYVRTMEAFLSCNSLKARHHNAHVFSVQRVASHYNEELAEFRAREDAKVL